MLDVLKFAETAGYKALEDQGSFLKKFMRDKELSDGEKEQFLVFIAQYNPCETENFRKYAEGYMQKNKLKSDHNFNGDVNTAFIRINDLVRFIAWIEKLAKDDIESTVKELVNPETDHTIRESLFDSILNTELRPEILHTPSLTERFLGISVPTSHFDTRLKEGKTSEFIEWSFPEPNNEDIFSADNLQSLDCRAGLLSNHKLDKVVYRHSLYKCKKICKPTIYDAEFYEQFEPGGKTNPLTECDEKEGFEEYVHPANYFKNITSIPIQIKK